LSFIAKFLKELEPPYSDVKIDARDLDVKIDVMYSDVKIDVEDLDVKIETGMLQGMGLRAEIKNPEALGRMLQQGRLLHGLTQRELAETLGISQKYIWQMEAGTPTIFTERLFKLMRATGIKLEAELEQKKNDKWPTS